MLQFTFCMEIEAGTLHGWRVSKAVFTVRPAWVTNGRRSAVIAMLGASLRMFQFRRGMDGPFLRTKQGGLPDFAPHTMQFLVSSPYGTTAVLSYSKIKPERKRALLYTLMFARAIGIFCCLRQLVSHTWQFVVYISLRLQ